jgi:regulator of sirC expression with transglutaminase-like and TPR domain
MAIRFAQPTPLQYFASLVQSNGDFALLEAATSLAQDEYPDIDIQAVLCEVDRMQARVQRRLPRDAAPLQRLRTLNHYFFGELGFACNINDYYEPDNSFMHMLLQTRRGIPVSLAVLWMELAQGLGLPVQGLCFPGHFLVKVGLPMGQAVMDPVSGRSLGREDLAEKLAAFQGATGRPSDAALDSYLQGDTPRDIVARMLRNLKEIYQTQEDWTRLLATINRLIVLVPDVASEYRDRGLVYAQLGQPERALADLTRYLNSAATLADGPAIAQRVQALLRRAQP